MCGYDLLDCGQICNLGCETWMPGNGFCNPECNTAKCNFDEGDCGFCSNAEGNTCDSEKLANGTCDEECNSFFCNFDYNACGG